MVLSCDISLGTSLWAGFGHELSLFVQKASPSLPFLLAPGFCCHLEVLGILCQLEKLVLFHF